MDADTERAMRRIASKAKLNDGFLGYQLAQYAARHGLTDELLMEELDVSLSAFSRLCVCGKVRAENFDEDVQHIAKHIGCKADVLAKMVR